jgi:hypothetical protein
MVIDHDRFLHVNVKSWKDKLYNCWLDYRHWVRHAPVLKYWYEFWYWFRTNTYNRYHMVDCRAPQHGYKWGWCDRCEIILYANFAILTDFVEKEMYGLVDWDSEENHTKAKDEIMDLYNWWKTGRAKDKEKLDKVLEVGESYYDKYWDMEEKFKKKDNKQLIRLIKIREWLWT